MANTDPFAVTEFILDELPEVRGGRLPDFQFVTGEGLPGFVDVWIANAGRLELLTRKVLRMFDPDRRPLVDIAELGPRSSEKFDLTFDLLTKPTGHSTAVTHREKITRNLAVFALYWDHAQRRKAIPPDLVRALVAALEIPAKRERYSRAKMAAASAGQHMAAGQGKTQIVSTLANDFGESQRTWWTLSGLPQFKQLQRRSERLATSLFRREFRSEMDARAALSQYSAEFVHPAQAWCQSSDCAERVGQAIVDRIRFKHESKAAVADRWDIFWLLAGCDRFLPAVPDIVLIALAIALGLLDPRLQARSLPLAGIEHRRAFIFAAAIESNHEVSSDGSAPPLTNEAILNRLSERFEQPSETATLSNWRRMTLYEFAIKSTTGVTSDQLDQLLGSSTSEGL